MKVENLEKKTDPAHFSPNCTDPAHFVLPLFCEKALKISDTRQNASEREQRTTGTHMLHSKVWLSYVKRIRFNAQ